MRGQGVYTMTQRVAKVTQLISYTHGVKEWLFF